MGSGKVKEEGMWKEGEEGDLQAIKLQTLPNSMREREVKNPPKRENRTYKIAHTL